MDEPYKWRTVLKDLLSDIRERERVAQAIGVNPITISRWVTNKSSPRLENMRQLLSALPQQREQLLPLLLEEYPELTTDEQSSNMQLLEISSTFYASALSTFVTAPFILRSSSMQALILQQMTYHFDPQDQGIVVAVLQCMPPAAGKKVRSLRFVEGRTTMHWREIFERQTHFLGAEAQSGHAVMTGRLIYIPNSAEKVRMFAIAHQNEEESAVACPILKSDNVAGCLYVSAPQKSYFTQLHRDLIQRYADLLILGFEESDFYGLRDIDLGIMPPHRKQSPILASFQPRVVNYMIQCQAEGRLITRPQAEGVIWKEIEEELFRIPFLEDEEREQ